MCQPFGVFSKFCGAHGAVEMGEWEEEGAQQHKKRRGYESTFFFHSFFSIVQPPVFLFITLHNKIKAFYLPIFFFPYFLFLEKKEKKEKLQRQIKAQRESKDGWGKVGRKGVVVV